MGICNDMLCGGTSQATVLPTVTQTPMGFVLYGDNGDVDTNVV